MGGPASSTRGSSRLFPLWRGSWLSFSRSLQSCGCAGSDMSLTLHQGRGWEPHARSRELHPNIVMDFNRRFHQGHPPQPTLQGRRASARWSRRRWNVPGHRGSGPRGTRASGFGSPQPWRPRRGPGAAKMNSPYPFSGLLLCGMCGSTTSGHTRTPDRSHPEVRLEYLCYLHRVADGCPARAVLQEVIEADLGAVLRAIALPPVFALTVDKAVAARMRTFGAAKTVSEGTLKERHGASISSASTGRCRTRSGSRSARRSTSSGRT